MSLEERLERLEKSNHNWMLATVGVVLASAVFIVATLISTSSERGHDSRPLALNDTVRTHKLELVNQYDSTLLQLAVSDGLPTFTLTDEQASGIVIETRGGNKRLALSPGIIAIKGKDKPAVAIFGNENGGLIRLFGTDGLPVVELSNTVEGDGGIVTVRNTYGKEAVTIQATKTNEGMVTVHDVNGKMTNVLSSR